MKTFLQLDKLVKTPTTIITIIIISGNNKLFFGDSLSSLQTLPLLALYFNVKKQNKKNAIFSNQTNKKKQTRETSRLIEDEPNEIQ